jgi:hypothetical protein
VPKIQVTLSLRPSGWHEAQLDQPLSEALPRCSSGTMSRIGGRRCRVGHAERGVEGELAEQHAVREASPAGGVPVGTSRSDHACSTRSSALIES